MKECRYCGSFYEDSLSSCPNCGGSKVVTAEEKLAEEKLYIKEIQNQENSVTVPADAKKNKSGIALVLAILAIVVVICIAIFGGNGTSSSGQTKAESNTAYEQGVSCYNSGDYENAIMMLSAVAENSKHYDEAQEMLASASANYSADIISTASAYVEKQEHEVALALLQSALAVLPEDAELQNALNRTFDEYKTQVCSTAIAEADAFVSAGNYESAITTINSAVSKVGTDEELSAKMTVYTQGYKEKLFVEARDIYFMDGYQAAINMLVSAQQYIGEDPELLAIISDYQNCMPIEVRSLACIYDYLSDFEEWHFENEMQVQDYVKYNNVVSPPKLGTTRITYELNGEYEQLSGTLVWNANHTTFRGMSSYMIDKSTLSIYCDEVLVFSATINDGTREIPFSLPLTGVNYLRIEMTDFLQSGWGTETSDAYFAGISDFYIQKNVIS